MAENLNIVRLQDILWYSSALLKGGPVCSKKGIYLRKHKFLYIVLAALICSALFVPEACAQRRNLVFVGDEDMAPYSFFDDDSPSGYAVDLLRILSATIDRDIKIKLLPAEQLPGQITSGEANGIMGAIKGNLPIKGIEYSAPIGSFEYEIFVEHRNTSVNSLKSLDGTVVAIREGSALEDELKKHKKITLVTTKTAGEAIEKLIDREVTAVIADRNIAFYYIQTHKIEGLKIAGPAIGRVNQYSFAIKRENKKLLENIDRGIAELEENGTLQRLKRKWFGQRIVLAFPWKMVIALTSGITLVMLILAGILWVVSLNATVKSKTNQIHLMSQKMAQKDKLAVLGKLAGQIAHELRTPLSIINNSVYLLRKEGSEDRKLFEKRLQVLEDKIKLASNILESILSYSRVKAEVASEISIQDCIEEVLKDIETPETIKKKIEFEKGEPLTVFMDFHQLYSVIRNLALNAIQAMQSEGELTMKAFSSNNGSIVNIRVSDTGKGIPENVKNKIFDLFYSTKIMGTGLGLPISKSIVAANQGDLFLEKSSEKGTSFMIQFPSSKTLKK